MVARIGLVTSRDARVNRVFERRPIVDHIKGARALRHRSSSSPETGRTANTKQYKTVGFFLPRQIIYTDQIGPVKREVFAPGRCVERARTRTRDAPKSSAVSSTGDKATSP